MIIVVRSKVTIISIKVRPFCILFFDLFPLKRLTKQIPPLQILIFLPGHRYEG